MDKIFKIGSTSVVSKVSVTAVTYYYRAGKVGNKKKAKYNDEILLCRKDFATIKHKRIKV